MQLIHRNPWHAASGLRRDVDRILRVADRAERRFVPAVDIHEETGRYVVLADLPGVDPAAIELSVEGDLLTIRGAREAAAAEAGVTEHRVERARGRFERVFRLPETVAADGYEAEYRNGVLRILLPKAPETRPHRIEVTAN